MMRPRYVADLPQLDTPPAVWVDSHEVLESATDEDRAAGNAAGGAP